MNRRYRLGSIMVLSFFFALPLFAQAPPAPQNLRVQPAPIAGAMLQWDASTGATAYRVYKATDTLPFVELATVQRTMFYDWETFPGHAYLYFVRAFNIDGGSSRSDTLPFVLGPPPPPPVFGILKGTVTDDSTGLPLPGAVVHFFSMSAVWHNRFVRTDTNGHYRILLDTGNYLIRGEKIGYIPEWFDNTRRPDSASLVGVTQNDSVIANVGLRPLPLPVPVTINGTVTDSTTGLPLPGAFVVILRPPHDLRLLEGVTELFGGFPDEHFENPEIGELRGVVWIARTDSLGNYTAHVLGNNRYIAVALKSGYRFRFYDNKKNPFDADRIVVTHDTGGINFELTPGTIATGSFSGMVVDSSGDGIPSHVVLVRLTPLGPVATRYRMTDSLGGYIFKDVVPGKFFVQAIPVDGFAPAWYKNGVCGTVNWHNADTLSIHDSLMTPVDICVNPAPRNGFARIAGQIGSSSNLAVLSPLGGAGVYAISTTTHQVVGYDITESDGSYSIENIVPGTYDIQVDKDGYTPTATPTVTADASNDYSPGSPVILLSPDVPLGVKTEANGVPSAFRLGQNFPNPFNPSTQIRYDLPVPSHVKLTVYNVLGQEVVVLANATLGPGSHSTEWNGTNREGNPAGGGVYFLRMQATPTREGETPYNQTRKLILMK
jgi:hypothetical protein